MTLQPWQVIRRSSGAVLFDSSLGGLTLADQFLQVHLAILSQGPIKPH